MQPKSIILFFYGYILFFRRQNLKIYLLKFEIIIKIKGEKMPIVNIKLAKPALSKEQKAELIADITELLSTKYNKSKERVVVMLEDIESYDIGFGGESVEAIKAKANK